MPKRKSNSNKKLKAKLKPKTRSLTKKRGLKKSTKIIIGVVCVLGIVGIIVGVLVQQGVISSSNNNTTANTPANTPANTTNIQAISNALPNTSLMTLDTKLMNDGKENFVGDNKLETYKDELLNNYIQRFNLIFSKKISTDIYRIMFNMDKLISEQYNL